MALWVGHAVPRGRSPENSVLTLASGSRALGPGAGKVFCRDDWIEADQAGEVHARRTGVLPPPGSLVMPAIAQIAAANSELLHTVRLGYLTETLRTGGKTVAALVNADTLRQTARRGHRRRFPGHHPRRAGGR